MPLNSQGEDIGWVNHPIMSLLDQMWFARIRAYGNTHNPCTKVFDPDPEHDFKPPVTMSSLGGYYNSFEGKEI